MQPDADVILRGLHVDGEPLVSTKMQCGCLPVVGQQSHSDDLSEWTRQAQDVWYKADACQTMVYWIFLPVYQLLNGYAHNQYS